MDFIDIEELVDFNVPESYKNLLRNFPAHFRRICGTQLLYDSLEKVYEANRIVHAPGFQEHLADELGKWPEFHLVIGESGCGDWYVLVTNLDELEERVVFWDHEVGNFSETWPTLYNCLDDHYEFAHTEGKSG